MRAGTLILSAVLTTAQVCACAAAAADRAIDSIARRQLASTPLIGFGAIVIRDGVVIHEAGYGMAQLAPPVPADSLTCFDYFSIGKHVTAALALRLAERGLLDLDSPAIRYLPRLDTLHSTATIRQLLSHTSGLAHPEIDERDTPPEYLLPPTRETLLAWLSQGRPMETPGSHWLYYSDGFIIAATAAEQVARASYGELIHREFSEPLGLKDFAFELSPRAQSYMLEDGKPVPVPRIPYGWFSGAGSIVGTLGDLARWWMALGPDEYFRIHPSPRCWPLSRSAATGLQPSSGTDSASGSEATAGTA